MVYVLGISKVTSLHTERLFLHIQRPVKQKRCCVRLPKSSRTRRRQKANWMVHATSDSFRGAHNTIRGGRASCGARRRARERVRELRERCGNGESKTKEHDVVIAAFARWFHSLGSSRVALFLFIHALRRLFSSAFIRWLNRILSSPKWIVSVSYGKYVLAAIRIVRFGSASSERPSAQGRVHTECVWCEMVIEKKQSMRVKERRELRMRDTENGKPALCYCQNSITQNNQYGDAWLLLWVSGTSRDIFLAIWGCLMFYARSKNFVIFVYTNIY